MSLEIVAHQCNSVTSTRMLLPNLVDLILNIIECFDGHFEDHEGGKSEKQVKSLPADGRQENSGWQPRDFQLWNCQSAVCRPCRSCHKTCAAPWQRAIRPVPSTCCPVLVPSYHVAPFAIFSSY